MPSSSETHRGRSSIRRLPPDLAALNRLIQQRFEELRAAIRVPEPTRLKASERRSRQQTILGEALGLSAADVAVIEGARDGVPAAVLLRLMHAYALPVEYFLVEGAPLPPAFVLEQQQREFEALLVSLRASTSTGAPWTRPRPRDGGTSGRKGGWLKGLPRNPRTPEQLALRHLWGQARSTGFVPATLEELRQWGRQQGLEVPDPIPVQSGPDRPRSNRAPRNTGSRKTKGAARKGGWLKGLPRKPLTPEEEYLRQIWLEGRKRGLHFATLAGLRQWWAESGLAETMPPPEAGAGETAPTGRRAPSGRGRGARKPLVRRRRSTPPVQSEPQDGGAEPPTGAAD